MTHSADIYWPEDASHEIWESLGGQLITFDRNEGLTFRVPWQGKWSYDFQPHETIPLIHFPGMKVDSVTTHEILSDIDEEIIDSMQYALAVGEMPRGIYPIHIRDADMKRGSRKLDFVHPSQPEYIYSLNGAGIVSENESGAYVIDPVVEGYLYTDWLRDHNQSYKGVGSNRITQKGEYIDIPGLSTAGAYMHFNMLEKIKRTKLAQKYIPHCESTSILWHAHGVGTDFGVFVSKKPTTLTLQSVFMIAESRNIDTDTVSVYQHAVAMHDLHLVGAHFNYHFGNAEMSIKKGDFPTYVADFETFMILAPYRRDISVDTFNVGIPVTPYEAARAFDVLYFLKRVKPHYLNDHSVLPRWEQRMSAFFYGYFGKERVESWIDNTIGKLSIHATSPGEAFSLFSSYIIDPILCEVASGYDDPATLLRTQAGSEVLDRIVKKTILKIWLALERGESI